MNKSIICNLPVLPKGFVQTLSYYKKYYYYNNICKWLSQGCSITLDVYFALIPDQQEHFNNTYNYKNNKIVIM